MMFTRGATRRPNHGGIMNTDEFTSDLQYHKENHLEPEMGLGYFELILKQNTYT